MNKFHRSNQSPGPHGRNLPPLIHKREFSTPLGHRKLADSEIPIFSYLKEGTQTSMDGAKATHRFFSNTSNTGSLEKGRTLEFTEDRLQEVEKKPRKMSNPWELTERFESFELKSLQTNEFPRTNSTVINQFTLWESCMSELIPLLKKKHTEAAETISKVQGNLVSLFEELASSFKVQEQNFRKKELKMQRTIKSLESKALELQGASDELLRVKRLEEEQISKEIEEIFGQDLDYQNFRQKTRRLQEELQPTGATEVLQQLYFDMSKERNMPEAKEYDLNIMNPEEIETGIMHNFASLQKSTATRVFQLIESRSAKIHCKTQTEEEIVAKEEYDELTEQNDKTLLMHQAALQQVENLRTDINSKSNNVERLENDKTGLTNELMKINREKDQLESDLRHFRKDNNALKDDKEKLNKDLESSHKENNRLEDVADNLRKKITELEETIERNLGSIAQKEARIEKLQQKIGKKPTKKDEDYAPPVVSNTNKPKKTKKEDDEEWDMGVVDIDFMDSSKKKKKKPPPKNTYGVYPEYTPPENQKSDIPNPQSASPTQGNPPRTLREDIQDNTEAKSPTETVTATENENETKHYKPRNEPSKITESKPKVDMNAKADSKSKPDPKQKKTDSKAKADPRSRIDPKAKSETKPITDTRSRVDPRSRSEFKSEHSGTIHAPGNQPKQSIVSEIDPGLPMEEDSEDRISLEESRSGVAIKASQMDTLNVPEDSSNYPSEEPSMSSVTSSQAPHLPKKISKLEISKSPKLNIQREEKPVLKQERSTEGYKSPPRKAPVRQRIPIGKHYIETLADSNQQDSSSVTVKIDRSTSPPPRAVETRLSLPLVTHEPIIMLDKEVTASFTEPKDFIHTRSVGVYYNSDNLKSAEFETSDNTAPLIYLLPFNPNNIYGLKGDSYYHGRTFQAKPTIPDVQNSPVFKSPYKLSNN